MNSGMLGSWMALDAHIGIAIAERARGADDGGLLRRIAREEAQPARRRIAIPEPALEHLLDVRRRE